MTKKNNKIFILQSRIEKKLLRLKKITIEQWLISLIFFAAIQALTQYLTNKKPDPWETEYILEFYNDPIFYLGLMLTFAVGYFAMRIKSQSIKR